MTAGWCLWDRLNYNHDHCNKGTSHVVQQCVSLMCLDHFIIWLGIFIGFADHEKILSPDLSFQHANVKTLINCMASRQGVNLFLCQGVHGEFYHLLVYVWWPFVVYPAFCVLQDYFVALSSNMWHDLTACQKLCLVMLNVLQCEDI